MQTKLSRRDVLRLASSAMAGAVLAACGATPTATPMPTPTKAPVPPSPTPPAAAAPTAPAAAAPTATKPAATPVPPTATAAAKPTVALPSSQTKAELRLLFWSSYQPFFDKWSAPFKEKYPNVTISYETISSDGWGDKQLAQMVAGNAPDVMEGNDQVLPLWGEKNQLLDLKPLIERDLSKEEINDIPAWGWKQNVYAPTGVQMAFPSSLWLYEWFYNKDILDQAGIAYPKAGWTVNDYDMMITKLTQKDSSGKVTRWGGCETCYGSYRFQLWLRMFGGNTVDPADWTRAVINSDQCKAAVTWHQERMFKQNTLAQTAQLAATATTYLAMTPLAQGKVGILAQGSGDAPAFFLSPPKIRWGRVPPPVGPSGKKLGMASASGLCIWKGSKVADLGWELIKVMGMGAPMADLKMGYGLPPLRTSQMQPFKAAVKKTLPTTEDDMIDPLIEHITTYELSGVENFKKNKESLDLINPVFDKLFVVGDGQVSLLDDLAQKLTTLNKS
jgi:multiple sugar transport system substrate-binding protein